MLHNRQQLVSALFLLSLFSSTTSTPLKQTITDRQSTLISTIEGKTYGVTTCAATQFYSFNSIQEQNISPVINTQLISKFIIGQPQTNQAISKTIGKIMASHPKIESYIRLVLTHLNGFSIVSHPQELIERTTGHSGGVYFPPAKTIVIPDKVEKIKEGSREYYTFLQTIIHEFRHAAMDAAHRTLESPAIPTVNCHYSDIKEQNKVAKMIQIGDANVQKLQETLVRETKKQISPEEKAYLAQLRKQNTDLYLQNYRTFFPRAFDKQTFTKIEKQIGKKITVGTTINIDKITGLSEGDITVQELEYFDDGVARIVVTAFFRDPLHALVYNVQDQQQHVKTAYQKSEYLHEREAYLTGSTPPDLIAKLYPELTTYIDAFLERTSLVPTPYQTPAPDYRSLQQIINYEVVYILQNKELYKADQVQYYITWIDYAISEGEINAAKTGIDTLIKVGAFVAEANLRLARIYFNHDKDYKRAALYFKRAEKQKATGFSATDHWQFKIALEKTGQMQPAAKQERKATREFKDEFITPRLA